MSLEGYYFRELAMEPQQDQVPAHFGEFHLAPMGSLNTRTQHTPVEYRTTFANNLSVPVTVHMRNGLKFVMPPEPSLEYRTFVVRVHIRVSAVAYNSVLQALNDSVGNNDPSMEKLFQAFNVSVTGNMWKGGELVLDYELTHEQLVNWGGTVYFSEVDYMVSLESITTPVHHPFSEKGRKNQVLVDCALNSDEFKQVHEGEVGFGYAIVMIDNQRLHGVRYINISNHVYKITPQRDVSKRDGIYIVSNHSMSSKGGNGSFEERYYDFENAEERLGLWRTADEAQHGGDKAVAAKETLAKSEAEVERLKMERQKLDVKNGIAKAELESKLRERESELEKEREAIAKERAEREHQEAIRRQELKDHYEARSYLRKDTSEGLKFLPSILIGLGALFSVFKLTS